MCNYPKQLIRQKYAIAPSSDLEIGAVKGKKLRRLKIIQIVILTKNHQYKYIE